MAVHWIVFLYCASFFSCPLLGMSFHFEPKAQHDLCTRHVEASFARLAQRGITSDAGASASPVLDEFIPIEGCNPAGFCHDCFFSALF